LFLYTSVLTVGFYAGSTAVSLFSDEYRSFFVEHVPLGERIIDFTDSQGWDRAPVKTKVNSLLNGVSTSGHSDTTTQSKTSQKGSEAKEKVTQKASEIKEVAMQKAQAASKVASDTYKKARDKVKETTGKAVVSAQGAINERAETNKVVKAARDQGIKFSDGVEELVRKAEEALKVTVADLVPTPSVPPLSESNAAEPGPAPEVELPEKVKEDIPSNVYLGQLPIGFEPPPGYILPSQRNPTPRKSSSSKSPSIPDSSPLLAPQVAPFASSEPIIGQLASTIDALTRLIKSTPSASEKANSQLGKAKLDLINLSQRFDNIKAEERAALETKLNEQTQAYNKQLHEIELKAGEKFEDQERGWRISFNEEQKKLIESYQKKLEAELETQSEIINRRYELSYICKAH
jgi:mitofilin